MNCENYPTVSYGKMKWRVWKKWEILVNDDFFALSNVESAVLWITVETHALEVVPILVAVCLNDITDACRISGKSFQFVKCWQGTMSVVVP